MKRTPTRSVRHARARLVVVVVVVVVVQSDDWRHGGLRDAWRRLDGCSVAIKGNDGDGGGGGRGGRARSGVGASCLGARRLTEGLLPGSGSRCDVKCDLVDVLADARRAVEHRLRFEGFLQLVERLARIAEVVCKISRWHMRRDVGGATPWWVGSAIQAPLGGDDDPIGSAPARAGAHPAHRALARAHNLHELDAVTWMQRPRLSLVEGGRALVAG